MPPSLGPWPTPRDLRWTPAALVELVPSEDPVPAVAPKPPAPLIRAKLRQGANVAPEYPRLAVRRGLTGTVVLRLRVDAEGVVGRVEVAEPCEHAVLNAAAVAAAKKWQFEPATRSGQAVPDTVEQAVRFELQVN